MSPNGHHPENIVRTGAELAAYVQGVLASQDRRPTASGADRVNAELAGDLMLRSFGLAPDRDRSNLTRSAVALLRLLEAEHGPMTLAVLERLAEEHNIPVDGVTQESRV